MAKRGRSIAVEVLDTPQATLLDLLDEMLNKGVVAHGDVTLGVAGIDLVYLRLSALLCAVDRVLPRDRREPAPKRVTPRRRPRAKLRP